MVLQDKSIWTPHLAMFPQGRNILQVITTANEKLFFYYFLVIFILLL